MSKNSHILPMKKVSDPERIKILIVGGQTYLQRALGELIVPQPDMEVAMITQGLQDASRRFNRNIAQVAILDWPTVEQGADRALSDLMHTWPDLKWLAVSLYDDDFNVKEAFDKGIKGFVTKAMAADTLCEAVRQLHQGQAFCSPDVLRVLPVMIRQQLSCKGLQQ